MKGALDMALDKAHNKGANAEVECNVLVNMNWVSFV